jgi:alpha-galactosidase
MQFEYQSCELKSTGGIGMNRRNALKTMVIGAAAGGIADIARGEARGSERLAASGTAAVRKDFNNPPKQKMVMIGAGSAMFTQGIIIDWINRRPEGEWEIALVDINPVILEATDKLVRRYMFSAKNPAKITATVDRKEVLSGATIVVCTIGVGSRRAWEQDVFVPRKFGINQPVGDSVMPGGVSRAMRMIPPMLDIAKDAQSLCPEARFINYSNPMPMIVRALWKKTNVRPLGLCMGTEETVRYLANFAGLPPKNVTARWVGLNHLTWITELRSEGKDAWPLVRAKLAERRNNGIDRTSWASPFGQSNHPELLTHPFSWELFDEFGAFPAPMDRHVTEYFPERFPGGKYYGSTLGVDAYSFERTIAAGDKIYDETINLAKETGPIDPKRLEATEGEHMQTMDILSNFYYDRRQEYAVNVPNRGAVPSLPFDSILEVPAVTTQEGMATLPVGEISAPLAAVLLRRIAVVEAAVEAALTGNRKVMVEALILDGGVSDYGTAEKLAEALLKAQAEHLPQFA